jgi:hypothetical protein
LNKTPGRRQREIRCANFFEKETIATESPHAKKLQEKLERKNTVGERIARTGRLGSFSEEEEGQDHSKVAMQNRVYTEFEKNFRLI